MTGKIVIMKTFHEMKAAKEYQQELEIFHQEKSELIEVKNVRRSDVR